MRTALVAAFVSVLAQDKDTAEKFYRFKVGTTWTFKVTVDGKELKGTFEVMKDADGKVWFEAKEFDPGSDKPRIEKNAWYVENGFLVQAEERDDKLRGNLNLYKLASKKGDTWPAGADLEGAMAEHMGTTTVVVPAGTYRDALHVQVKAGRGSLDIYLVPGVGLVKLSMGEDKKVELKEFKPAE